MQRRISVAFGSSMGHVILLGDSILDNQAYVEPGPAVADQLRSRLPNHQVTLLAVDGSVTAEVTEFQLPNIPADATHLVISSGGNDALREGMLLMRELTCGALPHFPSREDFIDGGRVSPPTVPGQYSLLGEIT